MMRRSLGFSLIELLVAAAVLAILATVAFRGLGPVLDTQVQVQSEMRHWSAAARVMEQLGDDLPLALAAPRLDAEGTLLIDHAGARRVGYRVREGALEHLAWPESAPVRSSPSVSRVLEQTAGIEWRILGADGAWVLLRPARPPAVMPRAVEVRILLAAGERITRIFALP